MASYTNTRPSIVTTCDVRFQPGETLDVPGCFSAALEAKNTFGRLTHPLRIGAKPILVPGAVDVLGQAPFTGSDLSKLDEAAARRQIADCRDMNTLAEWHDRDHRSEIKTAIEARASALSSTVKAKA